MSESSASEEAAAEPDPRIGTTIDGRYLIKRRLGAGGFGVVYEAEHVLIKRRVAVKMLHAKVAEDTDLLMRFKREAIAATATGHPHIVEVLDMGRASDGAAYMVLELLEGRDWSVTLDAEGPQPLGLTVRIVRQVLDGLAAAHDKGIVHRDLKAENVFLIQKDGQPDFVKIVDFGISKMHEEGSSAGPSGGALTHTGMALGTPPAMAPEQFQGKKDLDHRADLWAVGVMLHRALTGHWPFGGDTYALLAVNVLTEQAPPLRELRPDVPEGVATILSRLLEKDRALRYQTAREVRAALLPYESDTRAAPKVTDASALDATAVSPAVRAPRLPATALPQATGGSAIIEPAVSQPRRWPLYATGAVLGAGLVTALAIGLGGGEPSDAALGPTPTAPSEGGSEEERDAGARAPDVALAPEPALARGRLLLQTDPPGCVLSIDGRVSGLTPRDEDLPAGVHALEVHCLAEDLRASLDVTIVAGDTLPQFVDLTPRGPRAGHGHAGGTSGTTAAVAHAGDPEAGDPAPPVGPAEVPHPVEPPGSGTGTSTAGAGTEPTSTGTGHTGPGGRGGFRPLGR